MSYFRHPKTTQERRKALADTLDGLAVRRIRFGHNLPSAWDDVPRCRQRSWKEYRKTKWRAPVALAMLALTGCASHYIAADKDISRMSAPQLTLELSKP